MHFLLRDIMIQIKNKNTNLKPAVVAEWLAPLRFNVQTQRPCLTYV